MFLYEDILREFNKKRVKYVLVGGMAFNFLGGYRNTLDMDILVELTDKNLEKLIEMRANGDKVTHWFSANGETITQEQRQKGGIVFSSETEGQKATIWLKIDGSLSESGSEEKITHLKKIFSKFLDGTE